MSHPSSAAVLAALAAPIPPAQVRNRSGQGGKRLSFIRSRTAMNRLDEETGGLWRSSYRVEDGVLLCRIEVLLLMPDGMFGWVGREDGCGTTEETANEDDAEKGALSTAFKRAAVHFGIGRELYGDGVARWAGRDVPGGPGTQGKNLEQGPSQAPAQRTTPSDHQNGQSGGKTWGKFDQPRNGRGLFAWSKAMQDHFKFDVAAYLNAWAKREGLPWQFGEWDDGAVALGYRIARDKLCELPTYNGEFAAANQLPPLKDSEKPPPGASFAKVPAPAPGYIPQDGEVNTLKRRLVEVAKATIQMVNPDSNGALPPSYDQAVAMIAQVEAVLDNLYEKPSRDLKGCQSYDDIRRVYNAAVSNYEILKASQGQAKDPSEVPN